LTGESYASILATKKRPGLFACYLSDLILVKIKEEMKSQNRRFRVVVQVTLGQKKGQDFICGTRSLLNSSSDNFAEAIWETDEIFVVVVVHGIFTE